MLLPKKNVELHLSPSVRGQCQDSINWARKRSNAPVESRDGNSARPDTHQSTIRSSWAAGLYKSAMREGSLGTLPHT